MLIALIGCEHFMKVDGDLGKPVPELPLLENKLLPGAQGEPGVPENFIGVLGLLGCFFILSNFWRISYF